VGPPIRKQRDARHTTPARAEQDLFINMTDYADVTKEEIFQITGIYQA